MAAMHPTWLLNIWKMASPNWDVMAVKYKLLRTQLELRFWRLSMRKKEELKYLINFKMLHMENDNVVHVLREIKHIKMNSTHFRS